MTRIIKFALTMKRISILLVLAVVCSSHELFLKTDSYFLDEYAETEIFLYNGTFDQSENYITSDRIVNAIVLGPGFETDPAENVSFRSGNITWMKLTAGRAGTYVAGVSTLPRNIELSAEDFLDYLEHEDLDHLIRQREEKGLTDSPAMEKYSKHAKALLQVGAHQSPHWSEELGYPIEFIPLVNPYQLRARDEISLKLLFNGKPLPDQVVHFGSRSGTGDSDQPRNLLKTDANGTISMALNEPGTWFVSAIHIAETSEPGLDYESNWATLTFAVQ